METRLFRVVQQGEPFAVQSQKAEGGQVTKSVIQLQELGGKYENQYVAAMLGKQARFYPGEIVAATLRFNAREHNGQTFQDILVTDIVKLCN